MNFGIEKLKTNHLINLDRKHLYTIYNLHYKITLLPVFL